MSESILDIQNVTKAYASKVAVNDVSLTIPSGSIFGLLGPNGAGKTTLIRMINRITMPDSGKILFMGQPLAEEHQAKIGYLPEERGLYKKMKVAEQIEYLLRLKNQDKKTARELTRKWVERFELENWTNAKVQELSKGMQQKVQFIATIAHAPPVLILDEPFSGLDPVNTQLIEDVIFELRGQGVCVIFSTHRMEQVEQLCDRIAMVSNGKIVMEDTVKDARRKHRTQKYYFEFEEALGDLTLPAGVEELKRDEYSVTLELNGAPVKDVFAAFDAQGHILKFEEIIPSLRDIFIEIAGRPALEAQMETVS